MLHDATMFTMRKGIELYKIVWENVDVEFVATLIDWIIIVNSPNTKVKLLNILMLWMLCGDLIGVKSRKLKKMGTCPKLTVWK